MQNQLMANEHVSNDELLATLAATWRDEGDLLARFVAYLAEVDRRRLYLEEACSSLFRFCIPKLGMSEGEAIRRMTAARLVQDFPQVLEALEAQRVHLSALVLLRDLFTHDNVDELLDEAAGKSTRAVKALVARLAPKPDVPDSIRQVPAPKAQKARRDAGAPDSHRAMSAGAIVFPIMAAAAASMGPTSAEQRSVTEARPRNMLSTPGAGMNNARVLPPPIPVGAQISPLSETRHKVQFTASSALRDKLERAQSLMRHRNVNGDLAAVFERALELLIAKLEKEKFAATRRPKRATSGVEIDDTRAVSAVSGAESVKGARIPAAVRRDVFRRDGEQCSFVGSNGERCAERDLLEIDHRHPCALGGASDIANLRVLCRAHNLHAAERVFGREHVARAIDMRRRKSRGGAESTKPVRAVGEQTTLLIT